MHSSCRPSHRKASRCHGRLGVLLASIAVMATLTASQGWSKPPAGENADHFNKVIAPLLARRCLECHSGPAPKGKLDLSQRAAALAGGESGPVLVAGSLEESLLWEYVSNGTMPPKEPLSDEEQQALKQWIAAGAAWTSDVIDPFQYTTDRRAGYDWWSLQPLAESAPPPADGIPAEWAQHPLDRFVYVELMERSLRPSPPADKRTLIRRATFDLLGLPPTPDEIDAFVRDDSPHAYEHLIDRLLASPHYGERWGRHWLDVIRFGESSGYEKNHLRDDAWPFRDWVIRSFNEDKPYDQFVREQLAGDVVAPGQPDVELGTGFLVAGSFDAVGNSDPAAKAQIRANTLDDTIMAIGAAFLGLTVNCARCHDHKFDPIAQADYYRLQSTLAGVEQGSRTIATPQERARWEQQRAPLLRDLAAVDEQLQSLQTTAAPDVAKRREALMQQFTRAPVDPVSTEESFTPVQARFVRLTVLRTQARDQSVVLDEIEVWNVAPMPSNVALAIAGAKVTARSTRTSDGDATFYSADHLIDGKFDTHWISGEKGGQCTIELPRMETISRVVWSNDRTRSFERPFSTEYQIEVSLDGQVWTKVADHSGRRPADPRRLEELLLLNALAPDDQARHNQLSAERDELQTKLDRIAPLPTAWAGRFKQPREATYLMIGGDVTRPGPAVAPASLGVLSKVAPRYELDTGADEASRRLALANWLVSPDNPLAARVLANRLWHYHFGRGIVATPSDFGFQGARPTHPELLDWLAWQALENGWRTKPIHRLIMTSMTYRQSGAYDPELAAIDADAAYLWRFPPKRLEAEAIRDAILSVAGALDVKIGGPGFRLYHYWIDNVATYVPLDRVGPETYRRAVYHQNPRSVKVDLLGEYDLPDCSLPAPNRATTTSPLQALALTNHSFMLDMAQAFAHRLQREAGEEIDAQVARAFELALGRLARPEEARAAEALVRKHGAVVFCHAILNANEFIYVD